MGEQRNEMHMSLWGQRTPRVQQVWQAMRDCTPPQVPMPIRAVLATRALKKNLTHATIELWNGMQAEIEVGVVNYGTFTSWQMHWCSAFAINWTGRYWEICPSLLEEEQEA